MNRMITYPESKEDWLILRDGLLTSTNIACLYGLSKYETLYELWHGKKERRRFPFEESERMRWGNRLEDAIAQGVAEDRGWTVRRMKEFIWNEEWKIGSSFDYCMTSLPTPEEYKENSKLSGYLDRAIVEIKNVDSLIYREEWTEDEAPPHIELQVQHQMLLAGLNKAYIVALVGGNELTVIERDAVPEIQADIKKKCADFWESIEKNQAPEPDFEKDAEFIAKLYSSARGNVIDATDDEKLYGLASLYRIHANAEKDAKAHKDAVKAEILTVIGDAPKAMAADYTISAGEVKETEVKYTRKAYRNFKITWKKKKEKK